MGAVAGAGRACGRRLAGESAERSFGIDGGGAGGKPDCGAPAGLVDHVRPAGLRRAKWGRRNEKERRDEGIQPGPGGGAELRDGAAMGSAAQRQSRDGAVVSATVASVRT